MHRRAFHFSVAAAIALTGAGCEGGIVETDARATDAEHHDEDARALDMDAGVEEGDAGMDVGQDAPVSDVGEDSWVPAPADCVLYPQAGCGPGLACYPVGHEGSQCVRPTASRAQPGEPCDFTNDCVPGSFCPWSAEDAGVWTCEEVCVVADPHCPVCVTVAFYRLPPGFGVCRR